MKKERGHASDGSEAPSSSAVLPGGINTAARSTMEAESYERGYPEKREHISMNQIQKTGGKR